MAHLSRLPAPPPGCLEERDAPLAVEDDARVAAGAEGEGDLSAHAEGRWGQLHEARLREADRVQVLCEGHKTDEKWSLAIFSPQTKTTVTRDDDDKRKESKFGSLNEETST